MGAVTLTVAAKTVASMLGVAGLHSLPLVPLAVATNLAQHLSEPREKLGSTQRG